MELVILHFDKLAIGISNKSFVEGSKKGCQLNYVEADSSQVLVLVG